MVGRIWERLIQMSCVISLTIALPAQTAKQPASGFPSYFAPDRENEGFAHAQQPSDGVLDALLATTEAKESAAGLQALSREKLRGLFQVVRIRLSNDNEQDFLVQGSGPLTGADCYWFWIVRVKDGQTKALLFVNGLAVTILTHTTKGYRDIRGDWATAAFSGMGVFQYDGTAYKRVRERSWANKP
jgi:hypothetical protein